MDKTNRAGMIFFIGSMEGFIVVQDKRKGEENAKNGKVLQKISFLEGHKPHNMPVFLIVKRKFSFYASLKNPRRVLKRIYRKKNQRKLGPSEKLEGKNLVINPEFAILLNNGQLG